MIKWIYRFDIGILGTRLCEFSIDDENRASFLSIGRLSNKVIDEARETIRKYVLASLHYMENALIMLDNREAGKASELLWGSMAEALQAVAASRDIRLKNHRSLRWFMAELSKELGDKSIVDGYYHAERLHTNFHEVDLTPEDIALVLEPIRETVKKLLDLIPKELVNEPLPNNIEIPKD